MVVRVDGCTIERLRPRHIDGNAILPDGACRSTIRIQLFAVLQCFTSDFNRRLENRRIATNNSTARSG